MKIYLTESKFLSFDENVAVSAICSRDLPLFARSRRRRCASPVKTQEHLSNDRI